MSTENNEEQAGSLNEEIKPESSSAELKPVPETVPEKPAPTPMQPEMRQVSMSKQKKIGIIALILILAVIVGYFSLDLKVTNPGPGAVYPYTTTYDVWFPLGEKVRIGSTEMIALSTEDEMLISIDNDPAEKIRVGEERKISERRAMITAIGVPLVDTNFQIFLQYKGLAANTAYFHLTVKTARQVPQFLIDRLLPPEIRAQPA